MRTILIASLVLCLTANAPARAHANPALSAQDAAASEAIFAADQLDNLLAPIALYPDPLIAQVLPAASFVDQIDEAARWLRSGKSPEKIDKESWDVAVKAVAHYPEVLYMMADTLDWTAGLGQAYVTQPADVMASIQRLRGRAQSAGTLVTTPQQAVIVEQQTIKIVPAQPQVIYVPQYNPQVVYVEHDDDDNDAAEAAAVGAIAFGTGLAIGAWLNNDCDWHGGHVYYHGWSGSGWVGSSRTYVNVNNNFYVNRSYTNVNVNRNVVNRNVNYNNIQNYGNVNRNVNYNNVNANRVNTTNRQNVNASTGNRAVNNGVVNQNINASDARLDPYRGNGATKASQSAAKTGTGQGQAAGARNGQQPAARVPTPPTSRPSTRPTTQAKTSDAARQPQKPTTFDGYKGREETQRDSGRGRTSRESASAQGGGGGGQGSHNASSSQGSHGGNKAGQSGSRPAPSRSRGGKRN